MLAGGHGSNIQQRRIDSDDSKAFNSLRIDSAAAP